MILEHQKDYSKQKIKALHIPTTQQYEIVLHKKCVMVIKQRNALESGSVLISVVGFFYTKASASISAKEDDM